jgi:hypothetical protein
MLKFPFLPNCRVGSNARRHFAHTLAACSDNVNGKNIWRTLELVRVCDIFRHPLGLKNGQISAAADRPAAHRKSTVRGQAHAPLPRQAPGDRIAYGNAFLTRPDLERLIRAAGKISGDNALIIIGSQAVLGQYPDAPEFLLRSMEADLYPLSWPERAEQVDGAMGEGSHFHQTHGYYAQGVGPDTATLPKNWQKHLVRIANSNTGGISGLCLEVHDLAISKYVAGREKDREFTQALARYGMTKKAILIERLSTTTLGPSVRTLVKGRITRDFPR